LRHAPAVLYYYKLLFIT